MGGEVHRIANHIASYPEPAVQKTHGGRRALRDELAVTKPEHLGYYQPSSRESFPAIGYSVTVTDWRACHLIST